MGVTTFMCLRNHAFILQLSPPRARNPEYLWVAQTMFEKSLQPPFSFWSEEYQRHIPEPYVALFHDVTVITKMSACGKIHVCILLSPLY